MWMIAQSACSLTIKIASEDKYSYTQCRFGYFSSCLKVSYA